MGKITKEQLAEAVDKELADMIKNDPARMAQHMLIQMGRMCVEANAAVMDIKTESTLEDNRYEIKCKITIKKIKMPKPALNQPR